MKLKICHRNMIKRDRKHFNRSSNNPTVKILKKGNISALSRIWDIKWITKTNIEAIQ